MHCTRDYSTGGLTEASATFTWPAVSGRASRRRVTRRVSGRGVRSPDGRHGMGGCEGAGPRVGVTHRSRPRHALARPASRTPQVKAACPRAGGRAPSVTRASSSSCCMLMPFALLSAAVCCKPFGSS